MKKYSEEIRQKIFNMIKNGTSKMDASRMSGIPYRTVMDWTINIKKGKTIPSN